MIVLRVLAKLYVVSVVATIATITASVQAADSRYVRSDSTNTKVIVFVHGVIGDSISTWTNQESNAYWPALMAADKNFEKANIYVFDYPSPPLGAGLSVNEMAELMRRRLQSDKVLEHPELIFLSHSMGGLITRAFLVKYREQAAKVKFAYFYSTPTEGSPTARLASLVSRNPQFGGMYPMNSDSYLADLQRDWLAARLGVRSFCAYERKSTYGALIVDQRSASNLCTEALDPIAEDHVQIVKPAGMTSESYIAFKNAFLEVAKDGGVIPNAERTKTDHPYIDPERPTRRQVQLFPEDKVRLYDLEALRRVKLGGDWKNYYPGRTYIVIGIPGVPITPEFDPMPKSPFKFEVEYNKYVDKPRDLNGLSSRDAPKK